MWVSQLTSRPDRAVLLRTGVNQTDWLFHRSRWLLHFEERQTHSKPGMCQIHNTYPEQGISVIVYGSLSAHLRMYPLKSFQSA